ncbi:MAG: hypothetical protein AUI36_22260 [Cyanobacteria bacterium 13_1_40CM_2_61_4]|nr:MAG: hypothetical protein AUI36_22260 [Cyanobacteria bacterium 13_1_40CM_2_61_4]
MRDGVEFDSVSFAAQAQGFERYRASTREHIEDTRRLTTVGIEDIFTRLFKYAVGDIPGAEFAHTRHVDITLLRVSGCGYQCPIDGSACRDNRTTRPPEMQCGDVAVAQAFLTRGFGTDLADGDEIFYKAAVVVGHGW